MKDEKENNANLTGHERVKWRTQIRLTLREACHEGWGGCLDMFGVSSQAAKPKQGIIYSVFNRSSQSCGLRTLPKQPPHGLNLRANEKEFGT